MTRFRNLSNYHEKQVAKFYNREVESTSKVDVACVRGKGTCCAIIEKGLSKCKWNIRDFYTTPEIQDLIDRVRAL